MAQHLFRKEAIDARHNRWLGRINLTQPTPLWIMSALALTSATLIVVFIALGSYTKRSRVVGQLVPVEGMATLLAPTTGVVTRINVIEGQHVRAGETVAILTVPRSSSRSGDVSTAVESQLQQRAQGLRDANTAAKQLLEEQRIGLDAQLAAAERELSQMRGEILTRSQQVTLAEETLARLELLRDSNYVSELQLKQQQTLVLEQVGNTQMLQREAIMSERLIAQLQQSLRQLPSQLNSVNAELRSSLAALEQEQVERLAQGEVALTAQASGIVAAQLFKPGQAVQGGQPMMSVLPSDGRLEASLLVPGRAISSVDPGNTVLLRFQAYPYQKFGHLQGKVQRVSRSALGPSETSVLMTGPIKNDEPMYRVTVELEHQTISAYGRAEPLRPGLILEADILGDRVRLIEWMFAPLYSRSSPLL